MRLTLSRLAFILETSLSASTGLRQPDRLVTAQKSAKTSEPAKASHPDNRVLRLGFCKAQLLSLAYSKSNDQGRSLTLRVTTRALSIDYSLEPLRTPELSSPHPRGDPTIHLSKSSNFMIRSDLPSRPSRFFPFGFPIGEANLSVAFVSVNRCREDFFVVFSTRFLSPALLTSVVRRRISRVRCVVRLFQTTPLRPLRSHPLLNRCERQQAASDVRCCGSGTAAVIGRGMVNSTGDNMPTPIVFVKAHRG